ncbi:hypothetical protein JX265_011785 [Neoarthrinium moseri]|uniref:DUF4219 domain-containing protein n=1 Tax=Neoarthrinium moseri TaxID=1658444 RepID=A0A9P9WC27_9PEZI|nr:hypothetical protein JX265_011785 [Neoarthrinium moseri]
MEAVPCLLGSRNYMQWAVGLRLALQVLGLWYTIDSSCDFNTASDDPHSDKKLALAVIRGKLGIRILVYSWFAKSPRAIWVMGKMYGDMAPTAQLGLACALSEIQRVQYDSTAEFIDAFATLLRRMKVAGFEPMPWLLVERLIAATRMVFPELRARIECARMARNGRLPGFEEMALMLRGLEFARTNRG